MPKTRSYQSRDTLGSLILHGISQTPDDDVKLQRWDIPEHGVVEDVGRRVGSAGRHSD